MTKDFFTKPVEITAGEKTYKVEFDNKAYIETEISLQMGLCKIIDTIVKENNLKYGQLLELFRIGLMKHHSSEEIIEAMKFAKEDMSFLMQNSYSLQGVFVSQLLLPKVALEALNNKSANNVKKKTKMKTRSSSTGQNQ